MDAISRDAIRRMGRRLGLVQGKTFALEALEELDFVFDLLIYTAPPGETRAIDRYARKAGFTAGSDEALMLGAMRASRFALLQVERRHDIAGLIVADLPGSEEIWLMDEGLESSVADGAIFATRLHLPEAFHMTAGVFVPVDEALLAKALSRLPYLGEKALREVLADRRCAEAIYRVALDNDIFDHVRFEDAPEPALPLAAASV
jgi:hypothetical protein